MKEREIGGARDYFSFSVCRGDLMGNDHVGHLSIDWKIILKKPEVRVAIAPVRRSYLSEEIRAPNLRIQG